MITTAMRVSWRNHALITAALTIAGSTFLPTPWWAAAFAAWGYTFREAGQVLDYWPANDWIDHIGDVLSSILTGLAVAAVLTVILTAVRAGPT